MSEITPEMQSRLNQILGRSLGAGSHSSLEDGLCVMEAVSFVAGEPWSDSPTCACPVIAAFMRTWNDGLPSGADRDRLLKPLVPRLVGSRSTAAIEEQRAWLVVDWVVRVWTPTWLELVPALAPHAEKLRSLAAITDTAGLAAAGQHLNEAHTDASAARDAAWDAAWAAARDATAKFLQPTVERLQLSALDLIDRMLALRADIHHGGPQR